MQGNPQPRRAAGSLSSALIILAASTVWAQPSTPNRPGPWTFGSTAGLTLSPSSFSSDWHGGDKGSIV